MIGFIALWTCLGTVAAQTDEYRVRVDGRLQADEWVSGYGYVVRRTDVQYRLQLDALPKWGRAQGVAFFFDGDLGTDLGPSTEENRLDLGNQTTSLDLFRAEVMLAQTLPKVLIRLGRHTVYDPVGFDALDGASVRVMALPAVDIVGHAGLGLRTRWLNLGPVGPQPLNTVGRDRVGYVMGAGLESKLSPRFNFGLGWRRHFGEEIQQEKMGARLSIAPVHWLSLDSSVAGELIFGHLVDADVGLRLQIVEGLRIRAETRYHYPHFSADTIWASFARSPYHGAGLSLDYSEQRWRYWLRGEGRVYSDSTTQEDALWFAPRFEDESVAWLGHGAIERRLDRQGSSIGASASMNWGFGGRSAIASANLVAPIPWPHSYRPVEMNARLGAAWYEDAARSQWDGLSNWSVLGAAWRPDEGLRIGGQVEAFVSDRDRSRVRLMLTARMENGW